jgi:hypothetical protein
VDVGVQSYQVCSWGVPMRLLWTLGQMVPEPPTGQQLLPEIPAWQQVPPQVSVVQDALQTPEEQVGAVDGQTVVQVPQWSGLFIRSTQAPPQRMKPAEQLCWQVPDEHVWPFAQTVVQLPQCFGSVAVLVQTVVAPVPQYSWLQTHTEPVHTSPLMQAVVQLPQWDALDEVSTQVPPAGGVQSVIGGDGEAQTHAEDAQVPCPQPWPQLPQLTGSVVVSTHRPPQDV